MGLTGNSVGINVAKKELMIQKKDCKELVIALAGNPNVGKSTIFNLLTGMNQHTGNWPGKTVASVQGSAESEKNSYVFVDIPGTYSLMAHSEEEEIARNFICFGEPDATIVVCDATCLERNLNLVLQTLEISKKVLVCINLMDEAKKKGITIDIDALSQSLGVPVIGITARNKNSRRMILSALDELVVSTNHCSPFIVRYGEEIENAIKIAEPEILQYTKDKINSRWLTLKLLDKDNSLEKEIIKNLGTDIINDAVNERIKQANQYLQNHGFSFEDIKDKIVGSIIDAAEKIAKNNIEYQQRKYSDLDRRIDKVLTGKTVGYPLMIALLMFIFWLTITASNYPSAWLSTLFQKLEDLLNEFFVFLNSPEWLRGLLVDGMFRVLSWVVAVMLPPMAIFFPLFTLLEDVGYLPRIAYNLDKPFKKCSACGKQALTMCMGFGCNAAGVVGCRIIDSPRERLLAIITNSFVPCNGRFPQP